MLAPLPPRFRQRGIRRPPHEIRRTTSPHEVQTFTTRCCHRGTGASTVERPHGEDLDRKIEAMVEDHDWAQKELVSALTTDPGISGRTVRSHLKSLDGRTIKRSRRGRENRVSSMKRWLAGRERSEEFARAHSDQLKRLIDLALGEIPDVDPFGTPSDLVSVAFPSAERGPVRFSTKAKFAFEENILFDDLLHHVGQLELLVQPAAALPAFRKSAAKLSAARESLARGFAKTTRGTIAELARELNMWTKRAQTLRRNLVRSLQEAREFVIFPGRCRFVEVGGSGLSDQLLESTS